MSRQLDHIALANKNHDALLHLIRDYQQFPEWITTIAFYKAVQIIEAVCVELRGKGCNGHEARLRTLQVEPFKNTGLFKHHKSLWNESSIARYLFDRENHSNYSTFSDRLTPEQVIDKMLLRRLIPLEGIAIGLMRTNARDVLKRLQASDLPSVGKS